MQSVMSDVASVVLKPEWPEAKKTTSRYTADTKNYFLSSYKFSKLL